MFYCIKSSFLNILVTLRYDKFVIRLSVGMIQLITVHSVSYRDTACGFAPVWHLAHDNLPYHISTYLITNRVQKRWRHKKHFLDFSVLDTMYRWSMMKNIHSPNWVGIDSWGPEIWPHEYLISPIEISVNYEPGQFTPISMGLIRYSCGHISSHHKPSHVKFVVWGFFIMFYWNFVMKMLKCKKENLMTSHFSPL